MNTAAEIGDLKRELDILRAHYANFQRWARYMKNFFILVLLGASIVTIYSLVTMKVEGIGLGALVCAMCGVILIGNKGHWINLASPYRIGARVSDVEGLEMMIRDREKRLSDMKNARSLP